MQKFQRVPEIKPRGLTGTLVVCSAALLALIMAPSSPSPPAATGGDGEVDVYTLQPWTFLWFAENKSDKRWSCCWTSSHHQCSDWYFTSTLIPLWKSNSRFSSRIFSWLCLCCELMQSWVQGRRREHRVETCYEIRLRTDDCVQSMFSVSQGYSEKNRGHFNHTASVFISPVWTSRCRHWIRLFSAHIESLSSLSVTLMENVSEPHSRRVHVVPAAIL